MTKQERLYKIIENKKALTAWKKGVKEYALELIEGLELDEDDFESITLVKKALLNGASDWGQYSDGGCSLIYNKDIAQRLCTPSEFKKTNQGLNDPNKQEDWLDVQARALQQAEWFILESLKELK